MREKLWIFIVKFLGVSLALFAFWFWKGEFLYFQIFWHPVKSFYDTIGLEVIILPLLVPLFTNLLPFLSLMIITRGIDLKERLPKLGYGVLIIFGWHVFLSWAMYQMHGQAQEPSSFVIKANLVIYLFNFSLPFLLWIIFAGKQLKELLIFDQLK
jgi:hypothetical protein